MSYLLRELFDNEDELAAFWASIKSAIALALAVAAAENSFIAAGDTPLVGIGAT